MPNTTDDLANTLGNTSANQDDSGYTNESRSWQPSDSDSSIYDSSVENRTPPPEVDASLISDYSSAPPSPYSESDTNYPVNRTVDPDSPSQQQVFARARDVSLTQLYAAADILKREGHAKEELSFSNRSDRTVDDGQELSLMTEDSGGSRDMSLVTEASSGMHSDDSQADTAEPDKGNSTSLSTVEASNDNGDGSASMSMTRDYGAIQQKGKNKASDTINRSASTTMAEASNHNGDGSASMSTTEVYGAILTKVKGKGKSNDSGSAQIGQIQSSDKRTTAQPDRRPSFGSDTSVNSRRGRENVAPGPSSRDAQAPAHRPKRPGSSQSQRTHQSHVSDSMDWGPSIHMAASTPTIDIDAELVRAQKELAVVKADLDATKTLLARTEAAETAAKKEVDRREIRWDQEWEERKGREMRWEEEKNETAEQWKTREIRWEQERKEMTDERKDMTARWEQERKETTDERKEMTAKWEQEKKEMAEQWRAREARLEEEKRDLNDERKELRDEIKELRKQLMDALKGL